jgi:glucan phosphorylase
MERDYFVSPDLSIADNRYHTQRAPKRIYYFSIEWLIGRSLDNAVLNLGMKNTYEDASRKLGFVSTFLDTADNPEL